MAQQAQQPTVLTTKLRGEPPEVFDRDRTKSETYRQQFCVYRYMNPNNEIMATPYYCIMQHLSQIRGPLVDNWKDDQIQDLVDKTTQAQNPVAYGDEDLWMDYMTAFDAAFTDTTRQQTA
jgi:hypothetical protein